MMRVFLLAAVLLLATGVCAQDVIQAEHDESKNKFVIKVDDKNVEWVFDHADGGFLGIEAIRMTPELRTFFGAPEDAGVLIGKVNPDSAAAKAGLQVGDILLALGGQSVKTPSQLSQFLSLFKAGDLVQAKVQRDGQVLIEEVQLDQNLSRDVKVFEWNGVKLGAGHSLEGEAIKHQLQGVFSSGQNFEVIHIPNVDLTEKFALLEKRMAELEALLAEKMAEGRDKKRP